MAPSTDFVSAALRHARDAEHLLGGSEPSRDQVWHLAGFAHECARKAYLHDRWVPKLLGHDFASSGELVLEVALALDPAASRYPVGGWVARHPAIADWRPDHRYERTGSSNLRPVEELVSSACEAVDACMCALLLDGRLDMGSVR